MKNEIKPTLLVAVALLMALPLGAKAQNYVERTQIDTTVRLDRGGSVDLSLISGRIRVTGWDRPDVKVICSSGYSLDVVSPDFAKKKGTDFLQKPYSPDTLARTVRECLDA